jgi:hypothetical protein
MVKTFTAHEASKALILVKDITEDLRGEMETLILLQSKGVFPTETECKRHIEKLKHHFEELKQVGCVSREPQEGRIDFPSFYRDEPVFLCWELGEEEVLHWHGIHEEHKGRREITDEFLSENSKNSTAIA